MLRCNGLILAVIEVAPEFLGGFKNVRIFGFFVDADPFLISNF